MFHLGRFAEKLDFVKITEDSSVRGVYGVLLDLLGAKSCDNLIKVNLGGLNTLLERQQARMRLWDTTQGYPACCL